MKKLWHDIQVHKRAAALFLVYWLATLAVVLMTWVSGIPFPVVLLLFTVPLVAGILVGLWRSSTPEHTARWGDKISGGMLAGLLVAEMTELVMKGGVLYEVIGWMRGWEFFGQWSEVGGFIIAAGVFGVLLGLAGAVLTMIPGGLRRLTRPG